MNLFLTKCEHCGYNMTKENSKYLGKVIVGRITFLAIQCGKCGHIHKEPVNQK
jgi:uncharacterized Zn finger protein